MNKIGVGERPAAYLDELHFGWGLSNCAGLLVYVLE